MCSRVDTYIHVYVRVCVCVHIVPCVNVLRSRDLYFSSTILEGPFSLCKYFLVVSLSVTLVRDIVMVITIRCLVKEVVNLPLEKLDL